MLEARPVIQHTSANMKVLLKNNAAQKRQDSMFDVPVKTTLACA
jgi:hypothetical protein